ncbi:uncharacterized protein [Amphiura filiformis]|uniref:uncharacterized protein n=1 Tax=Amphiura filiformis TaxID=82378 RepID=UPI003B2222CA
MINVSWGSYQSHDSISNFARLSFGAATICSNGDPTGYHLSPYYQDYHQDYRPDFQIGGDDTDDCSIISLGLGDVQPDCFTLMNAHDQTPDQTYDIDCGPSMSALQIIEYHQDNHSIQVPLLISFASMGIDDHKVQRYLAFRRLKPIPRYHPDRRQIVSNTKKTWGKKRQAAFQRRRLQRQECLEKKKRLREIQLAGPNVIPSCGKHVLGCNLIDGWSLRPVMNPQNGAPITLGRGCTGSVDLARHEASGYLLAAKMVFMDSPESGYRALKKEIRALQAVDGEEEFPKLIGIIQQQHLLAFAMEFVGCWETYKTTTLYQQVYYDSGSISRNNWLMIIKDIGKGVQTLHGRGYIHADLHMNNVLIFHPPNSDRPKAKIIDLGFAVTRDCAVGLGYMNPCQKQDTYRRCPQFAPELVEGESFFSVQTDIFSYGRMIKNIATALSIDGLSSLSDECTCRNPMIRCTIGHVLREIDKIL